MAVILHFVKLFLAVAGVHYLLARDLQRRSKIGTPLKVCMTKLAFWAADPEWPIHGEPPEFMARLTAYRVILVVWLYIACFALLFLPRLFF